MGHGQKFLDVLRTLRRGEFIEEAGDQLVELIERVQRTGKPGKVTLTLTIKPPGKNVDMPVIWVTDQLKVVPPQAERADTMFYAIDGEVSRRDPRQVEMPGLRPLPDSQDDERGDEAATGSAQ